MVIMSIVSGGVGGDALWMRKRDRKGRGWVGGGGVLRSWHISLLALCVSHVCVLYNYTCTDWFLQLYLG